MTIAAFSSGASCRHAVGELALAAGAVLLLAWSAWAPPGEAKRKGDLGVLCGALGVAAVAAGWSLAHLPVDAPPTLFDGQLAQDGLSCVLRLLFPLVAGFVAVAAIADRDARDEDRARGPLLLLACLGMNLTAMARTLTALWLSTELASVAVCGLVAVGVADRSRREVAFKYVATSGVASGVMLYGVSWLYGVGHSLDFAEVAERLGGMTREQNHLPNAAAIGVACVLAALAFRAAAAPFHMGAAEVFDSAPADVAAFVSVAPVAAALAALLRFFRDVLGGAGALSESQAPWPILAGGLAVTTMTLGNLGALGEMRVRRLLGYAAMAQTGTMLAALSVVGGDGTGVALFYVVTNACVMLSIFGVLLYLAGDRASPGEPRSLSDLRGLGARAPWPAAALTIALLSLVGLPPLAGFPAKLQVLASILLPPVLPAASSAVAGDYLVFHLLVALVIAVNTVVSFFYCLRVVRSIYAAEIPSGVEDVRDAPRSVPPMSVPRLHGRLLGAMTILAVVPIVVLGVCWGPFYAFLTRTVTLPR